MAEKLAFPYEFEDVDERHKDLLNKIQSSIVMFKGTNVPCYDTIKKFGVDLYNFKPRPDDIWLIGFPRSGTTLLQEILYLLGTDLDYERAASQIMDLRFPFIEKCLLQDRNPTMPLYPHEQLEQTTEKRFIKSHNGFRILHPELLNVGCKVVFVARNPKDAIHSLAHYPSHNLIPGYEIQFTWRRFLNNLIGFGNYFDLLSQAWRNRNNKNLLIIFYEDIVKDKRSAILKVADFLGKKLTDDQLETLLEHVDIENFKNNKSLNNDYKVDAGQYSKNDKFAFIGGGKLSSWKDELPKEFMDEVDDFIRKNLSAIPDFEVPECWKDTLNLD